MCPCSLYMRILTCSCTPGSGHSDTLPILLFSRVCTENTLLFYFYYYSCVYFYYSIYLGTHVSLIHSLVYSYTVIWPFCSLVYSPEYLFCLTRFPLAHFVHCSCSPCMRTFRPSCLFLCLFSLTLLFSFVFPIHTENTLIFYYF
ncbi:hypothetical protein NERG_02693 [Nematocida ausubeli]|uniref:Uncharacterized protein n=1 Tax=Nematocida ausubeli (strain ATCC PRA-371 / ERTm2) TaxID=1913371 RepID=H8ZGH2_NEMA1|nr:hypothetical protein NERG_02693 [Nematocida ausubeli]